MAKCKVCSKESPTIARAISLCVDCIRELEDVYEVVREVHAPSRREYGLPLDIPKSEEGIICKICGNNCQIEEGQRGFCGLRYLEGGKLKGPRPTLANLIYYHDPLPTNCVAEWTCAATGNAYPRYSYRNGPEYGYKNLAVFYRGCSFDCLFCQNWHYKEGLGSPNWISIDEVLKAIDGRVACICYFGGDPGPQILNSILISERAREIKGGRILRFCWETNGNLNRKHLNTIIGLALESGGCIKFDLKAYDLKLHYILTGVSNTATLDNFRYVAKYINERRDPPLLIASTLLIPGYVEAEEVYKIAKFIAELDRDIPYSLLAFYPQYYLSDLPVTSKGQAYSCLEAAKDAGLRRVHIGNVHLLT